MVEADPRQLRARLVACVDLGKTSCRVRVVERDSGQTVFEAQGAGAPGLADARGAALSASAVETVLRSMPDPTRRALDATIIGAAGTEASPPSAHELAATTARVLATPTVVTSDVVLAHAGALRAEPGTVLVAGTGAVALSLGHDGVFRQADGWGPWVGDEGSGRWIGQEGIRAALHALDGRGPGTSLAAAMHDIIGTPHDVPVWISAGGNPARTLGSFAQIVFDLADDDDAVAAGIVGRAITALTDTAVAVSREGERVAVVGGLTDRERFRSRLASSLTQTGRAVVEAAGGALDGARLLTGSTDTPYERKLFHA